MLRTMLFALVAVVLGWSVRGEAGATPLSAAYMHVPMKSPGL